MGLMKKIVAQHQGETNFIGAESFATRNPYNLWDCYQSDKYAGIFPSVSAIAQEFMTIRPFAMNADGKVQENVPALNALYHPNQIDSAVSFFEKLAVMNLTHRKTYVLVWRFENRKAVPGGTITPQNIAGYTFLERPNVERRDGRTYYKIGAQEFDDKEVMVIPGGVDPDYLYEGYAPGEASRRWATLDQYIADYQQGFFENGAVPSGQFIITASSKQDFDDTVDKMQERHRGAGKNNNITYTPRPVDQTTGKPSDAKVEWIPFASTNKDIDFKNLFEQANNRIDSTYHVPASIRGVGENNNYATAQTDQQNFIRFAVSPLALRIYTQITHELNRITNGLGVAITFKLDIPAISDDEKVQAETRSIDVSTITTLVAAGYTLDSIVDALELPVTYKALKTSGIAANTEEDKPEVDDGDEVDDSPDPTKIDGVTPVNIKKVAANSANPKAELTDDEKLEKAARDLMESQIDRSIAELRDEPLAQEAPTESEIDAFIIAMMAVITGILLANGQSEYAAGVTAAGLSLNEVQGFILDETAESAYEGYLRQVGTSYGNDTAESIRKALAEANDLGLNRRETEARLKDILDTDDYRVKRLARTELNNSQNIGKLEGMKSLAAETNATWEKTIDHTAGNICPLCASREGIWTALDQPLWGIGEAIETTDDKGQPIIYINDWQTNVANDYHPNGRGTLVFRRTL